MTPSCPPSGPRPWGCGWSPSRSWWPRPTSSPSTHPRRPRRSGLFGRDLLAKAKPGIRIVNTARGGIVDEEALAEAIRDGIVAGAGLDVFASEPCTESPLFDLPQVVVSPHLGASTEEAQDKAGVTIAEQVLLALAGDFVPYAVNVAARDVTDSARAFMGLAEQLGRFFGGLHDGAARSTSTSSTRASWPPRAPASSPCRSSKGSSADRPRSPCPTSTRPQLAERRGLQVRESSTATSHDYKSLITLRSASPFGGRHAHHGRATHRAAHRHGRRPRRRGAALGPHAGGAQRRPARV